MRPVIGITSNYELNENYHYLADAYTAAVNNAGGTAVIIAANEASVSDYTKICHGIVLSGGGDLDPVYWDEVPSWALGHINPRRDKFEIILAQKCFSLDLPILGICRGCQVINVAAGGSLIQDINSRMSHQQKAPREYPFHDIFINKDTTLFQILNKSCIKVNSFHHQAVRSPGLGLKVTAKAEDDIIEAIEKKDHLFALGVQWHPECMNDENSAHLFRTLVEKAKVYKHRVYSKTTAHRTTGPAKS